MGYERCISILVSLRLVEKAIVATVVSAVCFGVLCLFGPSWVNAQSQAPAKPGVKPSVQAEKYTSALLIEAETGKVLFEKDPHLSLPPASMVKMMTALIVMEKVRDGAIKLSDR